MSRFANSIPSKIFFSSLEVSKWDQSSRFFHHSLRPSSFRFKDKMKEFLCFSGFEILNSDNPRHCPDKSRNPKKFFGKCNYPFFCISEILSDFV